MNVYKYDEITKEFIETIVALLDPLESKLQGKEVYLLPANSTFITPDFKNGFATVWDDNGWKFVEDNRGVKYWLNTDGYGTPARTMKNLGALPDNSVLTPPEKSIEQLKADKKAELKNKRDTLEVEPIEYNGSMFDYDEKARDRINGAIIALSLNGSSIAWTTADNDDVTVTADDLRMVVANVAIRSNHLHVKYRGYMDELDKCTTNEEVNRIVWED